MLGKIVFFVPLSFVKEACRIWVQHRLLGTTSWWRPLPPSGRPGWIRKPYPRGPLPGILGGAIFPKEPEAANSGDVPVPALSIFVDRRNFAQRIMQKIKLLIEQ